MKNSQYLSFNTSNFDLAENHQNLMQNLSKKIIGDLEKYYNQHYFTHPSSSIQAI